MAAADPVSRIPQTLTDYPNREEPVTNEMWATIADLVAWLDEENGRSTHETAMRLMKITEEAGEVMQAYIGTVGQNPRKGVTHSRADVAGELCDVILAAAVALHQWTDDPAGTLEAKLRRVAERAGRQVVSA